MACHVQNLLLHRVQEEQQEIKGQRRNIQIYVDNIEESSQKSEKSSTNATAPKTEFRKCANEWTVFTTSRLGKFHILSGWGQKEHHLIHDVNGQNIRRQEMPPQDKNPNAEYTCQH